MCGFAIEFIMYVFIFIFNSILHNKIKVTAVAAAYAVEYRLTCKKQTKPKNEWKNERTKKIFAEKSQKELYDEFHRISVSNGRTNRMERMCERALSHTHAYIVEY